MLAGALVVFYGCGGGSKGDDDGSGGVLTGHVAGHGGEADSSSGAAVGGTSASAATGGRAGSMAARGGSAGTSSGGVANAGRGGTSNRAGQGGTSNASGNGGEAGAGQAGAEGGASPGAGGASGEAGESSSGNGGEAGAPCAPGAELVENGDFEGGNFGFTTEYELVTAPAQITSTGACVIAADPSVVRDGATDWVAFGDHTNGSGDMFICDGNETAGLYAWSQTVTVEPHQSYELRFWFASVEPSTSLPSLVGAADGVPLGTPVVADATAGTWTQATAAYQAGDNTTVTLSIVDTNTDAGMNDFALDDVSFVRSCPSGS